MNANEDEAQARGGRAIDPGADDALAIFYDDNGKIQHKQIDTDPVKKPAEESVAAAPGISRSSGERPAAGSDASAEDYAEDIADLIEQKFMGLLRQRLAQGDGSLNEDDLAEMSTEFRAQMGEIRTIFLDAVKSYANASQRSVNEEHRKNAFHRLMVHRFESRLAPDTALDKTPDRLSRRMLPGFFSMLSLMIGQENLAKCHREADALAARLRAEMGDKFDWAEVYASKEGRRIALRAEILMARNFRDVEKRIDWLIAFINGNLISIGSSRPGAGWSFSEAAARSLLRDLFAGIRATMVNKVRRDALANSLNESTINQLRDLVAALG